MVKKSDARLDEPTMNDTQPIASHNPRHKTKKRKLLHREQMKRLLLLSFRVGLFLACMIIGSLFVNYVLHRIVQSSYLTIKDVQFEGCQRVTPPELMRTAGINFQTNILSLNLKDLARRLKANHWVKEVAINRIFPHALKIKVDERVPVALVSHKKLFLLDNEGMLFKEVEPNDVTDMPVITGLSFSAENSRLIKKVLNVLDTADATGVLKRDTISEIHLDDTYGITFYTLQEAIPIRIGFGDYQQKFALLAEILENLRNRKITPKAIDLVSSGIAHVRVTS